jgi:conserved oligomeric Golgi complex subunit 7
MECAILSAEIARIDIRGAVSRGVGAQGIELSETVRRMEESVPQIVVLLEASVERCITFTGGSEADELILALDDIMLQYISNLQVGLHNIFLRLKVRRFALLKYYIGSYIIEGTQH